MENIPSHDSTIAEVNDIPDRLYEIMDKIRQGREIVLTDHDKIIAKIIPVSKSVKPGKWPDFTERAISIFGKSPKTSVCESLSKTREERF